MNKVVTIGWILAFLAVVAMFIGHQGANDLNWISTQISTYAKSAPHDYFITASMLISAGLLLVIGLLVTKEKVVGESILTFIVSPITGAAASGLFMLSYYEETARTISALKASGFWSIRIQSFHDAGLDIFFYSSLILIFLLGFLIILNEEKISRKLLGAIILLLSPLSYFLMTTPWLHYLGYKGHLIGINQRAGLFSLWLAAVIFLGVASNITLKQGPRGLRSST